MFTVFSKPEVLSSIPPQNSKFIGVKITAKKEATTVRLMDKATLPFPIDEKKLERFPPGHAATRIIPSANPGKGLNSQTRINVNSGSKKN